MSWVNSEAQDQNYASIVKVAVKHKGGRQKSDRKCDVDGCGKPHESKGKCKKHADYLRRTAKGLCDMLTCERL